MSPKYGVLLALAAFVVAVIVSGCGSTNPEVLPTETAWQQVGAQYAGTLACRDCHANIHDDYKTQPMGDPATSAYTRHHSNLNNCGTCHVTGFGAESGFQLDGSTPQLAGVGCESCHGPGDLHIAAETKTERLATITRIPPDKACWDCHGDRKSIGNGAYRPGALNDPFVAVTSADLSGTAPSSVRGPHHPPAAFIMGRKGYNMAAPMASPHLAVPNTCVGCHQKTLAANGKVDHGVHAQAPDLNTNRAECSSCHAGGRSEALPVQLGIKQMLIELAGASATDPNEPDSNTAGGMLGAYATANNIALSTNLDPTNEAVINYKGARHNIRYVMGEGSFGVHNPAFAKKLLEDAKEMLTIEE